MTTNKYIVCCSYVDFSVGFAELPLKLHLNDKKKLQGWSTFAGLWLVEKIIKNICCRTHFQVLFCQQFLCACSQVRISMFLHPVRMHYFLYIFRRWNGHLGHLINFTLVGLCCSRLILPHWRKTIYLWWHFHDIRCTHLWYDTMHCVRKEVNVCAAGGRVAFFATL